MRPNLTQEPAYQRASLPSSADARTGALARIRELFARYRKLIRYGLVGSIGYIIYVGLLALMYDLALVPFLPGKGASVHLLVFTHSDSLFLITTLIGTQASIFAVFAGHTLWTFSDAGSGKPLWLRFGQFEARALVSTLGILTLTVNAAVLAGVQHYVAVALSIVVTFTWNWLWDSKVVWRKDNRS
jgi:putative flippase GtrA